MRNKGFSDTNKFCIYGKWEFLKCLKEGKMCKRTLLIHRN